MIGNRKQLHTTHNTLIITITWLSCDSLEVEVVYQWVLHTAWTHHKGVVPIVGICLLSHSQKSNVCLFEVLPHLTESMRVTSLECSRWEGGMEGRRKGEREAGRHIKREGERKGEEKRSGEIRERGSIVRCTLLAAELVMSIHVSAALCQNTPTVLLQLNREREKEKQKVHVYTLHTQIHIMGEEWLLTCVPTWMGWSHIEPSCCGVHIQIHQDCIDDRDHHHCMCECTC